jgi:hypothetical protein
VFGGQVHLLQGWTTARQLERDERWTVAELEDRAGELFGDREPGVPRLGIGG